MNSGRPKNSFPRCTLRSVVHQEKLLWSARTATAKLTVFCGPGATKADFSLLEDIVSFQGRRKFFLLPETSEAIARKKFAFVA